MAEQQHITWSLLVGDHKIPGVSKVARSFFLDLAPGFFHGENSVKSSKLSRI